jgi:hypothetical protein
MPRKVLRWSLVAAVAAALGLAGWVTWSRRGTALTWNITRLLADRLEGEVTLDHLEVSFWPRVRIAGSGLTLRERGRPDMAPLVTVDRFDVWPGLRSLVTGHVNTIYVDGLHVHVPPPGSPGRHEAGKVTRALSPSRVFADHLVTHHAELVFERARPDRLPLVFVIHDLEINDIAFDRAMPFHARLTNPIPTGLVDAQGTFGPWRASGVRDAPLRGRYVFSDADLSTIRRIAGSLSSTGTFEGRIGEIAAHGVTEMSDFSLTGRGAPMPLATRFEAVVNGADGTTVLRRVDATLGRTAMVATGAITNVRGPKGYRIDLHVNVPNGRIEDLLRLTVDSPQPLLSGNVTVDTDLRLEPGPATVRERLQLNGTFTLRDGRFTDPSLQIEMDTLSRRGRGKPADDPVEPVVASVRSTLQLSNGVVTLPDLTLEIPGATVALEGTYALADGTIDLGGTLRMQAKVSQAFTGVTSLLLKLVDPFFKAHGAGATVPIRITGTPKEPKVSVAIGRVLRAK